MTSTKSPYFKSCNPLALRTFNRNKTRLPLTCMNSCLVASDVLDRAKKNPVPGKKLGMSPLHRSSNGYRSDESDYEHC